MFRSILLSLALVAITVQPLFAACVDQAIPELRRGAPLTILRTDGSMTRATFIRAEGDPPRFVLDERIERSQRAPRRFELAGSDIARLEAPARPTFHGERVGKGALLGFAVGGLVGAMIPRPTGQGAIAWSPGIGAYPTQGGEDRLGLVMLGGFTGLLVGTLTGLIVSTGGGKPRIWSCEGGTPAAADST
jgi:hypothetical protein